LLSQLAAITFEQGDYFFEESRLQQLITDYLRTSPNAQTDSVALEQDSLAVVKSIEIQHGLLVERARRIYSFSHLTFQEYFTARAIVTGTHLSLPQLAEHVTEKRWREVFLLTAQMLPNADELLQLMKQQVDALVSADETLQPFLSWVSEKSLEVKTPYKPAAIRAFYLALALPPNHRLASDQTLALAIDRNLAGNLGGDLALDLALVHALGVALALTPELAYNRMSALRLALDLNHLTGVEVINDSLKQLKNQLPNPDANQETIKQWWQGNGQDWASQLRTVMIDHRNIGHKWHLSEASQHLVEQYANASQLLVECLNSNCQLTPTVRQTIEERLLLSH
jgi:predicted NACHT family NTPase